MLSPATTPTNGSDDQLASLNSISPCSYLLRLIMYVHIAPQLATRTCNTSTVLEHDTELWIYKETVQKADKQKRPR